MNTFRVGDKVYYLSEQPKIYTLEDNINNSRYPLVIEDGALKATFTREGHIYISDSLPSIFHATEENCRKLSDLYGVEFEAPPEQKTPRDIIQSMLNDGWDTVPVVYVEDGKKCLGYANKTYLSMSAQPFDPETGKFIIDYVDGQAIYEN